MKITTCMKIGGLAAIVFLTGCTTQLQKQEQVQEQTQAKVAAINTDCSVQPILYSNLKQPIDKRVYFMKSGVMCYESTNS